MPSSNIKNKALLKLFKATATLLEKKPDVKSTIKMHKAWEKFLLEVFHFFLKYESGTIANTQNIEAITTSKKNEKLYKIGSISNFCAKRTPIIRISGLWLEKLGFCIGEEFKIYSEKNQILIKKVNFFNEYK